MNFWSNDYNLQYMKKNMLVKIVLSDSISTPSIGTPIVFDIVHLFSYMVTE